MNEQGLEMRDERMIDSEETMAGAARQSRRRSCTCHFCKQGRCLATGKPLPDDDELRRQLSQTQAEVERLRREREIVRHRLRSARMHIPTSTPSPPDGKAAMKIGAKDPRLAYKIINDCIELLEGPNR